MINSRVGNGVDDGDVAIDYFNSLDDVDDVSQKLAPSCIFFFSFFFFFVVVVVS